MHFLTHVIVGAVCLAIGASIASLLKPVEPSPDYSGDFDHIANLITEQGAQMNEALAEIATEVTALKGAVASSTALLAALADQIEATAGNEAAARELAAAIRTETASLSAAVAANDGDPNT